MPTNQRDEELDRLENELKEPFIHRPDTMDLRDGMLCWLDATRVCGPDCVAYNSEDIGPDGVATQGPNRCLPLVYMGQSGAAALASIAASRRRIVQAQDQARENQVPPPNPRGK